METEDYSFIIYYKTTPFSKLQFNNPSTYS